MDDSLTLTLQPKFTHVLIKIKLQEGKYPILERGIVTSNIQPQVDKILTMTSVGILVAHSYTQNRLAQVTLQ